MKNNITWPNAKTAAEAKTFNGLSGYLVTMKVQKKMLLYFQK